MCHPYLASSGAYFLVSGVCGVGRNGDGFSAEGQRDQHRIGISNISETAVTRSKAHNDFLTHKPVSIFLVSAASVLEPKLGYSRLVLDLVYHFGEEGRKNVVGISKMHSEVVS